MSGTLLSLAERKRMLVAESDQLRREVSGQLDAIEDSVRWIEEGLRVGKAVGKGASLVGVLGGLALAWKTFHDGKAAHGEANGVHPQSGLAKWIDRGFQAVSVVSPLLALFRR